MKDTSGSLTIALVVLLAAALLAAALLTSLPDIAAPDESAEVRQQRLHGDANRRAWDLNYKGHRYFQSGRIRMANSCYREALAVALMNNLTERAVAALENIAMVFEARGDEDSARHYYAMAETTALHSTDKEYLAGVYVNRCGSLYESGEVDSAIVLTLKALAMSRDVKDADGECIALENLGVFLGSKGLRDSSITLGRAALTLARNRSDKRAEERITSRLLLAGWPGDSIVTLERALQSLRSIPAGESSAGRVDALVKAAGAYTNVGNRMRARRLLQSARDLADRLDYRRGADAARAGLAALDASR